MGVTAANGFTTSEPTRTSRLKVSQTISIEGSITLGDLRELVERTADWGDTAPISISEGKSFPGEFGSSPNRISVTIK